jgi:crotonobetainyl-CoA:carnitine CoA-transferase CaiB-like acyl-CoA transferase
VVSHTFVITPNLLNETRVGYTWFSSNIRVQSPDTNNAAALGITQLHPAAYLPQYAGAPTINVTGVGQFVDVSMLGVMSALVACEPFDLLERLGIPTKTGQTAPRLAPFGIYQARDGYIALCAPTEAFARNLFAAMGRPELSEDERFRTRDSRVKHVAELDALVSEWIESQSCAEVLAKLDATGTPAAKVRAPREAVTDPLVVSRGDTVPLVHPRHGLGEDVYGIGLPIHFSAAASGFDQPPPDIGEHNQLVYGEWLGYSAEQLAQLRAQNVI